MPDGISFAVITAPFNEAAAAMDKASDKATMFAIRSTGRFIQRAAKARAPVYHGTDPRAMGESGNLKKSIRNAKRLTSAGGAYTLKVGPFGTVKSGTETVRYGSRGGLAIDSRTAKHLKIAGVSVASGESTKGQVRGVVLYRAQMESLFSFMATGVSAVDSGAREIYEAAYAKAFARYTA